MLYRPYLQEMLYAQGLKNPRQFGAIMPQLPQNYGDQLPSDMQVGVAPIDLRQQLAQPQIAPLPTLQAQDAQPPQATLPSQPTAQPSRGVLSNVNDAMRTFVQSPLFAGIMNAARLIAASEDPKSEAYKEAVASIFEGGLKAKQRQDLEQSLLQRGFSPQEASVMSRNKDAMNALIQLRQQQQTAQKYGEGIISVDDKTGTAIVKSGDTPVAVPIPGSTADRDRRAEYKTLQEQVHWYSQMNTHALNNINELLPLVKKLTALEMGWIGDKWAQAVPGSTAAQVRERLLALKSSEGFTKLAEFRGVGGTLGQVTQGEHALLQRLAEILSTNLLPTALYEELLKAKARLQENRARVQQIYSEDRKYYDALASQQQRYFPRDFVPFPQYEVEKKQESESDEKLESMTWQEAERRGVKSYYDIVAGGIVDRY